MRTNAYWHVGKIRPKQELLISIVIKHDLFSACQYLAKIRLYFDPYHRMLLSTLYIKPSNIVFTQSNSSTPKLISKIFMFVTALMQPLMNDVMLILQHIPFERYNDVY